MPLQAGARLGPYDVLGPIGAGGMGEVYRAHDTRLDRFVAIKVLPDEAASNPEALARFAREARSVAALNHPNILAIYDVGSESGVSFAVTELLVGETLRSRLETGPLAVRTAIEYAVQIAEGLGAAHDRGIVHCDLKPENVFLTGDGRVKILDFGLARRDATLTDKDTQELTSPGVVMGSPGYIAPERLTGQPATAQTDIFALGVLLYEMLAGSNPFRRGSATETVTAILRDDAPPLQAERPGVPPGVARLIARCLEKRPDLRLRSARDLAFYLQSDLASPPAFETAAAGGPAVPAEEVRRLRLRLLGIPAALLALAIAAMWGFVHLTSERSVTHSIDRELDRARRLVSREHAERLTRLSLTARVVASFPELRALLATDAATIRDFLLAYQQRVPDAPHLIALGPDRRLLARTDIADTAAGGEPDWLAPLFETDTRAAVVQPGSRPLHAALAAAEAGGTLFGFVVAASPVDGAFAQSLAAVTQDEVVLLGRDTIIATTVRGGQTPWRSLDSWRSAGGRTDRSTEVAIGAQRYAARELVLVEQPPLSVVITRSRDEAGLPFRQLRQGVAVIGLLALMAAGAAAILLARLPGGARRPGAAAPGESQRL